MAVAVSEAAIRISLSGKMNIDDEMKRPPDEPQQASAASITPIHLVKDNFQDIYSISFMDVHDGKNASAHGMNSFILFYFILFYSILNIIFICIFLISYFLCV